MNKILGDLIKKQEKEKEESEKEVDIHELYKEFVDDLD